MYMYRSWMYTVENTSYISSNSLRNPQKTVTDNLTVFQSTRLEEFAYARTREFDDILQ